MSDKEAISELAATVAQQQIALEALTGIVETLRETLDRVASCGASLESRVEDLENQRQELASILREL